MSADTESYGVIAPTGSEFTFDLNGHELEAIPDENGEYAGSAKTKTQAMQLLKNSTVTLKDGTITSDGGTKMVIQNYSNLTLDNVKVEGHAADTYVLSNNFGEIHLKNGTQINAVEPNIAFDVWYGMHATYDDGVSVYIDTPDVVINGPIEFGHAKRVADEAQFLERAHLYVCADYDISKLTVINSTPNSDVQYEFVMNSDLGYWELLPVSQG